jgi:hypothetical protein
MPATSECCWIDYVAEDPCLAIAEGELNIHNCHKVGMSCGEFLLLTALCNAS